MVPDKLNDYDKNVCIDFKDNFKFLDLMNYSKKHKKNFT